MTEVTYQFSISNDFNGNLKSDQLQEKIVNSAISNNIFRIDTDDDDVFIVFENSLSSGDQSILNTLVNNHTPEVILSKFTGISPIITKTDDDSYTEVGLMTYRPIVMGPINQLEIIARKHRKVDSYSVRLVDLTNGKEIMEETGFTNEKYESIIIENPINIPTTKSILSVQVYVNKSNKGNNNTVNISNINLFHGN